MPLFIDPRDRQLAKMLIEYSVKAGPGRVVQIDVSSIEALSLGAACVEAAARIGAVPYLNFSHAEIQRLFLNTADEKVFAGLAEVHMNQMKRVDCYIAIRGTHNAFELSDVPQEKMNQFMKAMKPVQDERVNNSDWVVLRYPNESFAQMALTSTEAFRDFYYDVCLVDYAKMRRDVEPLRELMDRTDRVKITGPGTDLELSIKGIPSIPCCGEMNVPDGECFTAPVRESVNGVVQFNAPSVYLGSPFENVRLRFENGKVVEANAATPVQTEKLNQILDKDAGSRYVGEFAIGINPKVKHPMRDILFDEKIAGSFHMALGRAYEEANNGNDSSVHWDMVCIQRPDYGGGEMYFDGELVRKDGQFVAENLKALNWEE